MGKAPARYAHVLALSSFAKEHSVHLVPVAAQEFMQRSASNSSAVHKLERAKHIPVLCHQVITKACRSCLRCSYVIARLRMYLSTRQENPALETAVADEQRSKRLTNTASLLNRDKYQCKQRIGGRI